MWGEFEEPPGTMEEGPPETLEAKETCKQNKNQLESLKEIMLKNKQSLKKKEEEVQEYASRLSKIKSRTKLSKRSKEGASTSRDLEQTEIDTSIKDISQATTPKAKSSLLQRMLVENRKVFEQRNKEITETKRAVEEKVEAIRQQMDEKDLAMMELQKDQTVTPEMVIPMPESTYIQEKDNKIIELNNKISELEAVIIDLQENLKEKDSVIDSKTKAITLMSADLSKKGKTTLDTLEDTKDEMRTMQEHFILLESSLKQKNDNLLQQLHERDDTISELDGTIKRYENELVEQKLAQIANSDSFRSTLDTLTDTKSAMKSMQENFILMESSLKMKNDNLLQQLQDYEIKLAEANEKIFQLEYGKGIVRTPSVEDLQYNLNKLKENNRQLQDEKYELQKSIADMQNNIIASKSMHGNGAIMEKDNRIAELENLIEELKSSNDLLEEESKTELQKQLAELSVKNEDYSNRIMELEKLVHNLEVEKNDIASQLPSELSVQKENEKIQKLTKELDESNRNMIKMKAQHKSKIKGLQKQLENFKMVSDTNAELVKLGNQVALLEEEKASAGDWQERIADLESRVSMQTDEIQKNIDAIAMLENQKLDLIQELHSVKQKISGLEAEVADAENHRVTAEMKVVDLEEQLESMHKITENKLEMSPNVNELLQKIETLQQENTELSSKLTKLEEKGTSDAGSTESFETIHEVDKNELLKKIEDLTQRNDELTVKLAKLEERNSSHAGSTESFEAINDIDKNELLKKIDQLTQENNDLIVKLSRNDEKGSSDTGSTESFERIPEHNESTAKIELLTQENNDLVIKMTKLEEKLLHLEKSHSEIIESHDILQIRKNELDMQNESLLHANNDLSTELTKLKLQISDMEEENTNFQERIKALTTENNDLVIQCTKLEERLSVIQEKHSNNTQRMERYVDNKDQMDALLLEKNNLEKELTILQEKLVEQTNNITLHEIETNDTKLRMNKLLEENHEIITKMQQLEEINQHLVNDLNKTTQEKEELRNKIEFTDEHGKRKEEEKEISAEKLVGLQEPVEEPDSNQPTNVSAVLQDESVIIASLEKEIKHCKELIMEQTNLIEEMKLKLSSKEEELEIKTKQILDREASEKEREILGNELKEMSETIEEWKFKYANLEEKMNALEVSKISIENGFSMLQEENKQLIEKIEQKDIAKNILKEELESTIVTLESSLEKERIGISMKEDEIVNLKEMLESKNQELHNKYLQIQNEMIAIDNLQDQLNSYKIDIQQKDLRIASISQELEKANDALRLKEDEAYSLEKKNSELYEKLRESIPRKEYDKLLEELRDNEILVNSMQNKIDERMKEKNELLAQFESISQQNQDIQYQLVEKHDELKNVLMVKDELDARLNEMERIKTDAENRIMDLTNFSQNNLKFVDELKSELKDANKMMEQLKVKHVQDIEMHNQRFEDTIEELNAKIQECESLKTELLEKEKLISQNLSEERITLEAKVANLEQELVDSENKKQAQLEKMKKIVATLKRKTAMCQEFEARIAELEERWTSEKDEKEAKNKKNQEVESSMRDKDNKIADLEEKLSKAKNETTDSLEHVERLTNEVAIMKDKMFLLVNQISELEDEIDKLHGRITQYSTEIETEKLAKQSIIEEYESYKKDILQKYDQQQLILEETKENARELSVRMQVMETEYVEHLGLIKHLQAENGLLMSKQIQINEKLENTEKESEDRRLLIEELQKKIVSSVDMVTQTSEDELRQDTRPIAQQCDHCEQCQTIVQALEAKLQEREAEIENLDNELANSIGNFVQMRESLRFSDMMNQSGMRNRTMEDPYNDLLYQYNTLLANNEEIKAKLEYMVKENEEIIEKSKTLETLNATLQEKILATDKGVMQDEKYNDLLKKYNEREKELQDLQEKMEAIENEMKRSVETLQSEITLLKSEKEELLEKYKLLNDQKEALEHELEHLKIESNENNRRLIELQSELDKFNQKNTMIEETANLTATKSSNLDDIIPEEKYTVPQLFDASKIFGPQYNVDEQKETAKLQDLVNNKDMECLALKKEIDSLQKQMNEDKAQMLLSRNAYEEELKVSQERSQTMQIEIDNLQRVIEDKVKQIGLLNDEMNNVHSRMQSQFNQQENLNMQIQELRIAKDNEIQSLQVELNTTKDILTSLSVQCDEQSNLINMYKLQISNLEQETRESINNDSTLDLQRRLTEITKEKDTLQLQMNDLAQSLAELKQQNIILEGVKEKKLVEGVIQDLETTSKNENELQKATSESSELTGIQTSAPVTEQSTNLSVDDSNEKFNTDEDTWGWNADDVQVADDHHYTQLSIIPSIEIQLRTKIDEMEKKLEDLEEEKVKLIEENKASQIRSGKMVKKLKEYKVQIEHLQQQLKSQKSMTGLCELDSAIEEELRSQITELEKNLKELNEEHKNMIIERENLLKRIDVIVSANERYMETKERQDMDIEVLRLENKDLTNKIKSLEAIFSEENVTSEVELSSLESGRSVKKLPKKVTEDGTSDVQKLCDKYKEELEMLRDDIEALITENEQLQHYLEEQKSRISTLEGKLIAGEKENQELSKVRERKDELQGLLEKLEEEKETSKKQFEERLSEISKETIQMEERIKEMSQRLEQSETKTNELQKREENILEEKSKMEEKLHEAKITEEKLFAVSESLTEVTELLNVRVQEVADLKQELQKQYVGRQDAEEKLQENIQSLTQELKEKKQELDDLRGAFSVKESELIQQKSVETVSFLVSEATQELVQKHAIDIEERNKEIRDLRDKLNALQITTDEYVSELTKRSTQEETVASLSLNLQDKVTLLETVKAELLNAKEEFQQRQLQWDKESQKYSLDTERYLSTIAQLEDRLRESENVSKKLQEQIANLSLFEQEIANLQGALSEKEFVLSKFREELERYKVLLNDKDAETKELRIGLKHFDETKKDLRDSAGEIIRLTSEFEKMRISLEEAKGALREKESLLKMVEEKLREKQTELDRLSSIDSIQNQQSSNTVDGLPLFRMGNDNEEMLRSTIEKIKVQLEDKQQEIEHLKYIIEDNTYPKIIQDMQDSINFLYNEKADLENALEVAKKNLLEKQNQMESLIQRLDAREKEESTLLARERDKRSIQDQEEIVRLQNELHAKEQEINELKYVIAEKDSQLSQANFDPTSDDYELRENLQSLTAELYAKEQEIRQLKLSIDELQNEISRLKTFEMVSKETRDMIERLTSEKEAIRLESEELLERKLVEKESEIDAIKQRLSMENEELLGKLRSRDQDVENLKKQLETWSMEWDEALRHKNEELQKANLNLQEKEKFISEFTFTKEAEIRNLTIQVNEKNIRIEELIELSEKDEKELAELRQYVEGKEVEIRELTNRLEGKVKEYEMIQRALKKDFNVGEAQKIHEGQEIEKTTSNTSDILEEKEDSKYSNELDLALYMLHQRDVRCEELTHELMQLLEERDTLQLRLSNAIRINEELRKISSSDSSPKKDAPASSETTDEPLVEHPSPSKSEGPVEIAKEAIDAPIEEDKAALSLKLSQLHTVGHAKDVRLRDERELRHTQQMSLLAHKDVLSTLPPEAAAKLVNANYTLSRDVQSQSSVLLNWLWGKSTPKVMHM